MTLLEYIRVNYKGNQTVFAKAQGVTAQQVNKWCRAGWVVVDARLYSPKRRLIDRLEPSLNIDISALSRKCAEIAGQVEGMG